MTRFLASAVLALALAFALAAPAAAGDDEEEIPLDKLPKKVLDAVREQFPKGQLKSAVKGKDEDGAYFTVTLTQAKTEYDVTVSGAGKVTEIAKEIAFRDLPKAVAAAVTKRYPKGKVSEVAELTEPGVKGKKYHVELTTAGGKDVTLVLDATGKVLEED